MEKNTYLAVIFVGSFIEMWAAAAECSNLDAAWTQACQDDYGIFSPHTMIMPDVFLLQPGQSLLE